MSFVIIEAVRNLYVNKTIRIRYKVGGFEIKILSEVITVIVQYFEGLKNNEEEENNQIEALSLKLGQ
jgi:hypothetical protein